ncbi:MAG TPA: M3 family oligoendopeptidase [Candidatus Izemoplasmatales bacterium]|nr:M3 family oligoendopeptidase [Candidatus Izemoplasmatales bacterium]
MKTIETKRLILRSWAQADASDMFDYASLATVGPSAGWKPHETIEESQRIIAGFIEKDDVWAVELKENHKVIGSVGMHERQTIGGIITKELGYVLSTPYEGKGLMTEACKAVIHHVFHETQVDVIAVYHFLENDKSRRVIEKCGFIYENIIEYKTSTGDIQTSKSYKLTKESYLKMEELRNYTWNLDKLYTSFDSKKFADDNLALENLVDRIKAKQADFANYDEKVSKLKSYLELNIEITVLAIKLMNYAGLQGATDSTDQQAAKSENRLHVKLAETAAVLAASAKWIRNFPELDEAIEADPFLKEHEFMLKEIRENASHLLDDKTEALLAQLKPSGSTAWERLQALLTSTVAVDYEGKEITLSQVRNLAYEKDPKVRENAFRAELKAYEKIDKPVAFAINAIKGEVNVLSAAHGYESALAEALAKSRMQRATLDVMMEAMEEYLPIFRKYLKRKGELLGHKNGLPFYDIFAPMGKSEKTFTIPEAQEYILRNFRTFNERLYNMAKRAFEEGWIDYLPKKGKVGGAFCSNIHPIGESRVLSNFTGVFGDVITLAHELGHAYHGECIFGESILNSEYTMPVAETASTFCETIVNKAALKDAVSKDEKINLLESSIQDYTQVIVDIMSRFIFEKNLFEGRKKTIFDENELKEMMLDAQRKTYGDGLDPELLHPYMWLCKSHYYSGNLSFYNFPYAFGLLFAKGLYAEYLKDKEKFVMMYDSLLAATGKNTVEDAAKIAGIDMTKKEFWVSSLKLLEEDIEEFIRLTE